MRFRSILIGMLAIPLVSAGSAQAFDFSFGLGGGRDDDSYTLAQAGDPRITQLEELIRQLNGRVEELNFQILQMQDQMRKMQEDNEFRFQQLEGSAPAAAPASDQEGAIAQPAPGQDTAAAEAPGTQPQTSGALIPPGESAAAAAQPPQSSGTLLPPPSGTATAQPARDLAGTTHGEPPRNLGSITFDEHGNPTGGSIAAEPLPGVTVGQANAGQANAGLPRTDGEVVAALPPTDNPEELYRNSYEFILSGDYATAEAGFRDHIARYPSDPKAADAHYWLGEALLGQDRYRDAAEVFLEASRDYPDARKAPDMMLKLGVSLAALNQRDVACATYGEIAKRYPEASAALKDRVKQEQALAGC
jgi:tol-pal system protein YbgF